MASAFTELRVNITGDGRGFKTALDQSKGAATNFASQIKGQFAHLFGVAFLLNAARGTALWASEISDMAVEFGVATDELQALEYAFLQTGVSLAQFRRGMGKFGMVRNEALEDEGSRAGKILDLVFGFKSFSERKAFIEKEGRNLFLATANQFKKMDFGAATPGLLRFLFGTSGPKMQRGFKEGLEGLMKEAESIGFIVPAENIEKLNQAVDRFVILTRLARSVFANWMVAAIDGTTRLIFTLKMAAATMAEMILIIEQMSKMEIALGIDKSSPDWLRDFTDELGSYFANILTKEGWGAKAKALLGRSRKDLAQQAETRAFDQETRKDRDKSFQSLEELLAKARLASVEERDRLYKEMLNFMIPPHAPDPGEGAALDFRDSKNKTIKQGDALARIGGFVGASNRFMSIQEQQLSTQKTIAEAVKKGIPRQI